MLERILNVLADHPAACQIWRRLVESLGVRGRQVHDARLVALVQAHGITHILTLNGSDFARYPGIVVLDPAALVAPPPAPPPLPPSTAAGS